jgi:hypothetical protein
LHTHSPVFPEKQEGTGDCWLMVLKSFVLGQVTGTQDYLSTVRQIDLDQYAIALFILH